MVVEVDPRWSKDHGDPLTRSRIVSVIEYLMIDSLMTDKKNFMARPSWPGKMKVAA